MHWTRETLAEASGLPLPPRPRPLPWYARALMGVGGWVAAVFLLAFLACLLGNEGAWSPVGASLLAVAVFVQRAAHGVDWADDLLEQASLALGLAGRGLVFAGLLDPLGVSGAAFVAGLVEGALLFAFPTSLQRIASALALPTWALVAVDGVDSPWVVEAVGVVTGGVALFLLAHRHALERRAAQREARRLWGHRAADLRLTSGLASDVGMGLALWTMALEAFRFGGHGGGPLWGLLHGMFAAAVALWLVSTHATTSRQRLVAGVGAVGLVALGTQVPGLPIAMAFALVAVRTRHRLLAGLATVFAFAYGALFYYQLDLTLAVKGGALFAGGLLILGLRALAGLSTAPLPAERSARVWRLAVAGLLVSTLCLVQARVLAAEAQLVRAETVYLELGPRDPRSLVQGDYMVLAYRLDRDARALGSARRLVGRVDRRGVITAVRSLDDGPPAPYERILRPPALHDDMPLATHSFLFQEGHADAYAQARYGAFRLSQRGHLTLVGLADRQRQPLGPPRARW